MEISFGDEIRQLRLGEGETFHGEGILAITKALVELHGGRIWATSVVGKGSTFAFTLPIATELARL